MKEARAGLTASFPFDTTQPPPPGGLGNRTPGEVSGTAGPLFQAA